MTKPFSKKNATTFCDNLNQYQYPNRTDGQNGKGCIVNGWI